MTTILNSTKTCWRYRFASPKNSFLTPMKIRLLLIMAMLSCVAFLTHQSQAAPLVLIQENFQEASLGGQFGPDLSPTDQTGISPTEGTYQSFPNDSAEIVGGLGGSTKALKLYDWVAGQMPRALFKTAPANNITSGIVEASFDFKMEVIDGKAFEPYQYPLWFRIAGLGADGSGAGEQYLNFEINGLGNILSTNSTTTASTLSVLMGGASLELGKEYTIKLTLNFDTGLYNVSISDIGTAENLQFVQKDGNVRFSYVDFQATDFNSSANRTALAESGGIVDNLLVTHIPEPTAVSLLILGGGAGILAVRKRRSS